MRNIIIKLLLLVLFILFSAFVVFGEEDSAIKEMTKLPEIEYQQIFINGNKEYALIKPIFKDKEKYSEVNKKIDEIVDEKKWVKIEKEMKEDKDNYSQTYTGLMPEITYYDNNIISICFYNEYYLGGAHGGHRIYSIVVNRKTGKEITKDILGANKKDAFDKIYALIKANKGDVFFNVDEMEITREKIEKEAVLFYISKDVIGVMYNEYGIAPYTSGTPEFNYNMKIKKVTFVDGSF